MNIGVILAGGIGKRMDSSVPKQFLEINETPIIVFTVNKLLQVHEFDIIYIAVHQLWVSHLKILINKYIVDSSRIRIIIGGAERIDTIQNVIQALSEQKDCSDNDIIVIHEAVRPFVSINLLKKSIQAAEKYGAVVAASPVVDTMLCIETDDVVSSMPDRSKLYHGQAPDSFRLGLIRHALESLTSDERRLITGTAQICMLRGIPIHTIRGDSMNFKITTKSDLEIANAVARGEISESMRS